MAFDLQYRQSPHNLHFSGRIIFTLRAMGQCYDKHAL